MEIGKCAQRGQCLTSEAERLQRGEVIVGGELGGVVFEGYCFVVVRRNPSAVVLHLNGIEAIVLEADLCPLMSVLIQKRRLHGAKVHTNRGGACINAVLYQLFAYRLQVDNNLSRLDLVH